jgi:type VII secretion integral membrane protein EccD
VRVTVVGGTRRADLVVPGTVPVAELLPALARSLGLLDAATVHGGYRLATPVGRELTGDAGLIGQGVEDGDLLVLAVGVEQAAPRVYDDLVEATADVVERDLRPWDPASGRRVTTVAAGLLLVLAAVALLTQRGSRSAAVTAAVVAVFLIGGAAVLSRARNEPVVAVTTAWLATAHAAVAGLLTADGAAPGLPVAAAGGGALLAGLAGLVGLGAGRALMAPPVIAGTTFLATGLAMRATGFDPAVVLTTVLVLAVMSASVFPWLALESTGTMVRPLSAPADVTADPLEIDPARIAAKVHVAHDRLVALSVSVGLLLVLSAPLAVSLGLSGTLVAVLSSVVLMLRTRQCRSGAEVLGGMVSGVVGLISVAVSVVWLHADWRPAAAGALATGGGVLLALTLLPATPSVRRGRLGDVAESASLLLLPPLLVGAVGLLAAVRG